MLQRGVKYLALASLLCVQIAFAQAVFAAKPAAPPDYVLTDDVIADMRKIVAQDVVRLSVLSQNARLGALEQSAIDALDQQWRAETDAAARPLISRTLMNPASKYLTRIQSNAIGLYAAIFVMDKNGLNVGQSIPTADFWQGDEAKYLETFPTAADQPFIDAPEFVDTAGIWIVQVSFALKDQSNTPIGVATFDVNLTELSRRAAIRVSE